METEITDVLLIDDDEDDYIIIRDMVAEIQPRRFQLDWESKYATALERIRERKHDVYLIDYRLGEHTGVDLLKEALLQGCQAPVIILTGRGDSNVDASALQMGAADYLVKGLINASSLERSILYSIKQKRIESALRRAVEDLKRSNRDLEQFAYVASHELKEPLNMVVSYLQLLVSRSADKLEPTCREFIDFAVNAASRLQSLIEDLLQYSRIGIRRKTFRRVDCNQMVEEVVARLKVPIEANAAVVTHDELPTVEVEETQFPQVFQNLIANSIKFHGNDPPRIHIAVESTDQHWLFHVKDNGIGIPPEHSRKLFRIFYRLHGRAAYPGNGIGLALVKRIVEEHGGRVWFDSQPGKWTTFHFTIPRQQAAAGPEARGETARESVPDDSVPRRTLSS